MTLIGRNAEIRIRAFNFLDALRERNPEGLPREELARGFEYEGRRVPLLGPQGIFWPAELTDAPVSMTTVAVKPGQPRPYEDEFVGDWIHYRYRGSNPDHRDNVGLRNAMQHHLPLIYFCGLIPGLYEAAYPVFIERDDPARLTFAFRVDEVANASESESDVDVVAESMAAGRRAYVTRATQQRVHQRGFRARVLQAYRQCCAICRIKHRPLLDAAHILPDKHEFGAPIVPNGLSLCKIHHAAFDYGIVGIRPDLVIEVREDVLQEIDGPMLKHGIQELHGHSLTVIPRDKQLRPSSELLEIRYQQFRAAG